MVPSCLMRSVTIPKSFILKWTLSWSVFSFSALFNKAGTGDGQSDISKPSLVIYSINTKCVERAHTPTHHLARTGSCENVCYAGVHGLQDTQICGYSLTDTHTIETMLVRFFVCFCFLGGGWGYWGGHSNEKVLFKVSGKVPPSSPLLE